MNDLLLLPFPHHIETTGGSVDPRVPPVKEHIGISLDAECNAEAYRMEISEESINLYSETATGMRWARATLAQLQQHDSVPCMRIEDAPLFPNRGVMLDISRDRVPTMETLFALVDKLAAWKMNHLQLYVEHTIAYRGHEAVWLAASPITLEELADLDTYAAERGVTLTANQNCLGHFERWLCHPRYAPLAEFEKGNMVRGEFYRPPNTLCPLDPKSLELIRDLLSQQFPACSGAYANIGCDEPWDLGQGRSREACERMGKAAVFSEYVSQVAAIATKLGKRPQFWCDPEPNEDDSLPRDLVALIWQYENFLPFSPRVQSHRRMGREVWVAPGTSCWHSTTGRTWNRRENLDNAAAETEANGLLCTAWGDNGHRQPWPITLFGFADAAMAAWSGAGKFNDRAAGQQAFGNPELGEWLARLGNVDEDFCRGSIPHWDGSPARREDTVNATALWKEMHTNFFEKRGIGDATTWSDLSESLLQMESSLPEVADPLVRDECRLAAAIALWTSDRAVLRRSDYSSSSRKELAGRMVDIIAAHRRQWLSRCRYGGLNDSTAHFVQFANNW